MRLTRLDFLRGIAALAVLLFHYAGFWPTQVAASVTQQPLRWLLWPFYSYGGLAVQFFWLLSGIVFMLVYGNGEAEGFFIRRIARLYPLHFATLLVMAALNLTNVALFGEPLRASNSVFTFILQIFMASDWGLTSDHSFNFPIWSVSMEVLTYAAFYVFLRTTSRRLPVLAAWAGAFTVLALWSASYLATCASLFFIGAMITRLARRLPWWLINIAIAGALGAVVAIGFSPLSRHVLLSISYALFPAVLLAITKLDLSRPPVRWGRLGDITYGVYLTHIPVLTVFVMAMRELGRNPASEVWFLGLYVGVVVAVAIGAYRFIERPGQRWIIAHLGRLELTAFPR